MLGQAFNLATVGWTGRDLTEMPQGFKITRGSQLEICNLWI